MSGWNAVLDSAEGVHNNLAPDLGIEQRQGRRPTQNNHWRFQPMKRVAHVAEDLFCTGQYSGHSEQSFRLVLSQGTLASAMRQRTHADANELRELRWCRLRAYGERIKGLARESEADRRGPVQGAAWLRPKYRRAA